MKYKQMVVWLVICAAAFAGCKDAVDEPDVSAVVASEGCDGLVPNIYRTPKAYAIGVSENAPIFSPLQVIFMRDGVVIWTYDVAGAQIGQFTCEDGALRADFPKGNILTFTGSYHPENNSVTINDVDYAYYQDSP